jgi:hypothetical protein
MVYVIVGIVWLVTVAAGFAYGAKVGKNAILAERDELVADFLEHVDRLQEKVSGERDELRAKVKAEVGEFLTRLRNKLGV